VLNEDATSALGSGASVVFDHTVADSPDRFLVVAVGVRSSGIGVNSVTFGGATLAPLISASAGGYCRSELWGLVDPLPGTASVVVTLSGGTSDSIASAASYAGVDGRSPLASSAANHGIRGAVSLAVTSASDQVVVDAVCGGGNSAPTSTPGAGQTLRWNRTSGTLMFAGSDRAGTSSSPMTWTLSVPAALGWSIAAATLRAVAGASAPDAGRADATVIQDSAAPGDAPDLAD